MMLRQLRVLVLLLTSCSWGALAQQEREIAAALDGFHAAAAAADYARYDASMTADVVFLGTDGSERWQGDGFREFARPHFDSGQGWTYHVLERNITQLPDQPVAWFDEALSHATLGHCRGSGVMVHQQGVWKVAQYNLSVPIPNEMVAEVALAITGAAQAETTPAVSAESAKDENDAPPEPAAANCHRKRFKTNGKADC